MDRIHRKSMAKHIILLLLVIMALNFTQITGRSLAEETNGVSEERTHLDDTVRADPLDHLKKYRGGYDITNKHYWSSTAFTGIYGYSIAALWLICGVAYGGFLIVRNTCWKRGKKLKKTQPHCNKFYLQPLFWVGLFTLLSVIGTGVVLGGNAKFHSRAETIIDIIINAADEASITIYNTTGAMRDMNVALGQVDGNSETTRFLTSTSRSLDTQAADIQRQASRNRHKIHEGLKIVYIVTSTTISLVLVSVIALLVLRVLKFKKTHKVLIVVCWIFTALCWLFFGIYFFINNFAGDTCTAFESFQNDPYNNSLSSILPCDELLSAGSALDQISEGVYDLVNEVNRNLSTSYGNIVQICNPFSAPPWYDYRPSDCPATSIRIGDIPQLLRLLVCPDTGGQTCNGGILVPADYYNRVNAYSTSIQKLLDVYPNMQSLLQCQTVKDAFSEILEDHCKPVKRDARMVWISLVFLSVLMVALVLIWTAQVHHDQNRRSLESSVKPHSNTADTINSEKDKSADNLNPV